jgi:hypothetical protein
VLSLQTHTAPRILDDSGGWAPLTCFSVIYSGGGSLLSSLPFFIVASCGVRDLRFGGSGASMWDASSVSPAVFWCGHRSSFLLADLVSLVLALHLCVVDASTVELSLSSCGLMQISI